MGKIAGKSTPTAIKPVLSLVGFGTSDEHGITLAGLSALKSCSEVFAERYTNLAPEGTLVRLEELMGKKIHLLSREQVEGEKTILDALAKSPKVALVVSGDPMIATTHVSLMLAAKKKGAEVKIFHAASILSAAIGESGLQAYKFGKTVTLAYWRENYKPMAAYDVIAENLSRNLHTLLLLDIDEKMGTMKPSAAASLLLEMEKSGGKKLLMPETKIVLLQGVGWEKTRREFAALSALASGQARDLPSPAVIIIPAKLHFLEEEYLEAL